MLEFSFIDHGNRDFIRTDEGEVLVEEFDSWEEADEFIADGGLECYGWSNKGTTKFCWNEEDED